MKIDIFPIVVFFVKNPIVGPDNKLLGHDNGPQSIVLFLQLLLLESIKTE